MNQVKVIEQELRQCFNDVPCRVIGMQKGDSIILIEVNARYIEFWFDKFDTHYRYKVKEVRSVLSAEEEGYVNYFHIRLSIELRKPNQ